MYDWANSAYSLVITTTIFPIYYQAMTSHTEGGKVDFFGLLIDASVLYEYALSASFLLIALIAPLLSGIADYGGKRKFFMKVFAYLGSFSCMALFFFTGPGIEYGIIFSALASIGFAGSLVFYNSFLPVIATSDKFDFVSAKGFALGYIGSVILLLAALVLIFLAEDLGISDSLATRTSFLMVGIWWIGFAQISFNRLPDNAPIKKDSENLVTKGYLEIKKVWRILSGLRDSKLFLFSFLFYNTGVQTIIYVAALFGGEVLHLASEKLILTILIIQLVAIGGSYLFAHYSKRKGNRQALALMIIIWMIVCVVAYFIDNEYQFYALAFIVGLVLGGIQSLSRSTYSKLIPADTKDHTSFFSFYDVTEKISLVIGTFAYGLIDHITNNMRISALALAIFFLIGLIFLIKVREPVSRNAALRNRN